MPAAENPRVPRHRHPYAWLVWATAALGVALLLVDHWVHVLGVLPYLVILACPLMHFFMHRGGGHRHGGHHSGSE